MDLNTMDLSNIAELIELFNFNYIIADDMELNVISDEGPYNVPLENNNNVRYLYMDSNEYGNRSPDEIKKIKMLNDAMEIILNIYSFTSTIDENFYPKLMTNSDYDHQIKMDATPDDVVDGDLELDEGEAQVVDMESLDKELTNMNL